MVSKSTIHAVIKLLLSLSISASAQLIAVSQPCFQSLSRLGAKDLVETYLKEVRSVLSPTGNRAAANLVLKKISNDMDLIKEFQASKHHVSRVRKMIKLLSYISRTNENIDVAHRAGELVELINSPKTAFKKLSKSKDALATNSDELWSLLTPGSLNHAPKGGRLLVLRTSDLQAAGKPKEIYHSSKKVILELMLAKGKPLTLDLKTHRFLLSTVLEQLRYLKSTEGVDTVDHIGTMRLLADMILKYPYSEAVASANLDILNLCNTLRRELRE